MLVVVIMIVVMGMIMRRSFGAGRHHDEPAVAHAALADDMLGEMLDLRLRPAQ
jgi:hypothetical protein